MTSVICIISIAFLSVIPNCLSFLTHGNFPLHKTYYPFYSNPTQYVIPQGALLPRILGYPIVSQRSVLKAEDFCVSRGLVRTPECINGVCRNTYGIAGSLKKFYFPQVADITRARTSFVKSQDGVKYTDEQLSYVFQIFDKDGNGYLTYVEFLDMNPETPDNVMALAIFYIADSDSTGKVTETEYKNFMRRPQNSEFSENSESFQDELLRAFFHVSDDDGNGFLSLDEFESSMEQTASLDGTQGLSGTWLQHDFVWKTIFYLADTSSHGSLSEAEYTTIMKKADQTKDSSCSLDEIGTKKEVNTALFIAMDEDGNGYISIDELNKFMIIGNNILSVQELQLFQKLVDANGDGKIKYNEIAKMLDAGCRRWICSLDI